MDYVNSHSAEEIAKTIQPQFQETPLDKLTIIVDREVAAWHLHQLYTNPPGQSKPGGFSCDLITIIHPKYSFQSLRHPRFKISVRYMT